jgi:hypothetical protein
MTPVTVAPWAMSKMFSTALKQDFQKTTIPCRMFVPTIRLRCRYVDKVNRTTDLTEPKETH